MKRVMKNILPSILMLVLMFLWREDKDILMGIYVVFPLIYVVVGIISSDIKKELVASLVLLSIFF